jgi:D-alanyl-D-alanine carboxypeptidase
MLFRCVGMRRVRYVLLATAIGVVGSLSATTEADARKGKTRKQQTAQRGGGYSPPFAAYIVDVNSGRALHAVAENEPRFPASVTKVMTLYMLFEQLERGAIALDTEFKMSSYSAGMAPSKLYLRPGDTISVEDAIKALVTKSANDVAAAVAENLAGTEDDFAEKMTRKARQLGMNSTTFRNASGLPDPEQITTARDLSILARAIQEKFPKYYRYFQTRSFHFAGRTIGNHNRLLGKVEGVDGIKTGFTNKSGFNLMTSARLDGRHVVGIVLGGRSGPSRDQIMTQLVRTNLARASVGAGRTSFADAGERAAPAAEARNDVETTAGTMPVPAPSAVTRTGKPLDLNAMRAAVASAPAGTSAASPSVVKTAALVVPAAEPARPLPTPPLTTQKIEARLPVTPATPPVPAPPARAEFASAKVDLPKAEPVKVAAKVEAEPKREAARPPAGAWVIQLGAPDEEGKARQILAQARSASGRTLAHAAPFTERVVRAGATLYRARFSGFEEPNAAQEACRSLKRSGFECFATRS